MGLIARELEQRGIATVSLSCAWSITQAVKPPRAVFLDFPLGRTAGPPNDKPLQRRIMLDALNALESIDRPGEIRPLPHRWPDGDGWRERAMRPAPKAGEAPADDRIGRSPTPQHQTPEDEAAAAIHLAKGDCPGCVFPEQPVASQFATNPQSTKTGATNP